MDDTAEANSSFLDDSPVKAPAGSKSFKLLFAESLPKNGVSKPKRLLSRSKTTPTSTGLFGDRMERAGTHTDQDHVPAAKDGAKGDRRKNGIISMNANSTSRSLPGKAHLFSEGNASPYDIVHEPDTERLHSSLESDARKARKRSLSDVEDEAECARSNAQLQQDSAPKLLPPSPPANSSSRGGSSNFRGKGQTAPAGGRKKAKVQEDTEEEDENLDEGKVKRVSRQELQSASDPDIDHDYDPILGYDPHRGSRDPQIVNAGDYPSPNKPASETGNFEVDLPDRLRRVLAISPSSKSRESNAARVVRGLLSGRRATHYDPAKGGEIWDVGEEDYETRDTEGEDDWEAEGIPWEVGEL
jgi:hypothetical protein